MKSQKKNREIIFFERNGGGETETATTTGILARGVSTVIRSRVSSFL